MFRFTKTAMIFADKVRAGHIVKVDNKFYKVTGSSRSQKGQLAASYNVKATDVFSGKFKEFSVSQSHDFTEVRFERVRMLFSGFDDDDMACFVYPEHTAEAGKEVNLKGDSLPDGQQKFLACGMPVDILHLFDDAEDGAKDQWIDIHVPSSYNYTVEKIAVKGLYKMAHLAECDGLVSVPDAVQVGDTIKVILKPDGTASFGGRVGA